jgi:RNA polymerase sigma-70 factor (ECF subfamily)
MHKANVVGSAVQGIYQHISPSITKSVMHILKNQDDTDDIMQEAWMRYLTIADDHVKIENPQAFLRRIAVNLALDYLRHRHRKNKIFAEVASAEHADALDNIPTPDICPEDSLTYASAFQSIMNELDDLPPRCRQAFLLNAIEGHTHVEVSQNMGLSVSAIEKYCRRALQSVRTNVPNIFSPMADRTAPPTVGMRAEAVGPA